MIQLYRATGLLAALVFAGGVRAGTEEIDSLLQQADYDAVVEQVTAHAGGHYLVELIRRAEAQSLAGDPQWRALLHYRKRLLGGYISEVDGSNFFTSKRGKRDPNQELRTTLASFFSTAHVPPSNHTPQCRFLARYHWLQQKLDFDAARLPPQPCRTFDVFYQTIEPVGLTVVFPSTHPNSPSSMFGHTLIRIDGHGHDRSARLLDFTINYAAEADTSNGLVYAMKGLTGGFIGRFNVVPYHMKLREYAQMENRDIWEYRLEVSQRSVDLVLMHAWELLGTYFDYYFFTENCSYHVLTLLEADLYGHGLTEDFNGWVLPTDTLRVLEDNGLVSRVDYYPSSYRTILARRERLSDSEDELAESIQRDGLEKNAALLGALPPARQAATLDMAFDYLRYKKIAAEDELRPELNEREKELLIARSRIKLASESLEIQAPGIRPDQGHGTARVSLGGGRDENGGYISLGARAVYHDWLDPADGYSSNYALEFGRVALRYYTGELSGDRVKADHIYLVSLDNYEPLDRFFRRPSWHVTTGWESVYNDAGERDLAYMLRGGAGAAFKADKGGALFYAGLDAGAAYADAYESNFFLAAGPAAAVKKDFGRLWRLNLDARYLYSLAQDRQDQAHFSLAVAREIGKSLSLNTGATLNRKLDGWMTEAGIWLNHYF